MKIPLLVRCLSLLAVVSVCVAAEPFNVFKKPSKSGSPSPAGPLRILTLGDSITAMFRYQMFLRDMLKAQGLEFTFVGAEGKDENKHEGHSGFAIAPIEENVTKYLTDSNANVVLLQIGINSMKHGLGQKGKLFPPFEEGGFGQGAQPGKTLDEIGATWGDKTYGSVFLTGKVNSLLDKILTHPNAPLLVVAKIPGIGLGNPLWKEQNDDADARIREFNGILEKAVKERQAKGAKIAIVDNYTPGNRAYGIGPEFTWGPEDRQKGDWVHPTNEAAMWKTMATNFAAGLNLLLKK
jgi:hypothetical protein